MSAWRRDNDIAKHLDRRGGIYCGGLGGNIVAWKWAAPVGETVGWRKYHLYGVEAEIL